MQFQKMTFAPHRGVVIDDQIWSETRVCSSSGGGVMHGVGLGGGSTRSTVANKRETWLKLEDGREHAVELDANVFKLRPGHELAIVEATGNMATRLVAVRNMTTGQRMGVRGLSALDQKWKFMLLGAFFVNLTFVPVALASFATEGLAPESFLLCVPLLGNLQLFRFLSLRKELARIVDRLLAEAAAMPSPAEPVRPDAAPAVEAA